MVIADSSSANTFISVMGNAIITASYGSGTTSQFVENGLPVGTSWNVIYGSDLSSTTNIIAFTSVSGDQAFTIPNVTDINGNVYIASPNAGDIVGGNILNVTFVPVFYDGYNGITAVNTIDQSSINGQSFIYILGAYTLHRLHLFLNTNQLNYNVVIEGNAIPFDGEASLGSDAFRYVHITGNVIGSSTPLDNYIDGVRYNFTVPISVVSGNGMSPGNVRMYKYENGAWEELNTTLVYTSATDYYFMAESNSFSDYAIGYSQSTASATSGTSVSLTMPTQFTTYLFAGSVFIRTSPKANTVTWNVDANSFSGASTYENFSSVGHQTSNIGKLTLSGTSTAEDYSLVGIGVNAIFTKNGINGQFTANGLQAVTGTDQLTYTVAQQNSVVVLFFTVAGNAFSALPTLPTGCTFGWVSNSITVGSKPGGDESEVSSCKAQVAGTYSVSLTTTGKSSKSSMLEAAYVFPPYTVTLLDNPTSGLITTFNNVVSNTVPFNQASGNIITEIGDGTANAVIPSLYTFNSWVVDSANSANVVFASATSSNTFLSIMGNAIITATYKPGIGISVVSNTIIDVGQWTTLTLNNVNGTYQPLTANWFYSGTSNILLANTPLRFQLNPANVLQWVSNTPFLGDIYEQSCTTYSNVIYCIGGTTRSQLVVTSNVLVAQIAPNGNVLSWVANTPFPTGIYLSSCSSSMGFIYCVGGDTDTFYQSGNAYVSKLAANGNVAAIWEPNALLPTILQGLYQTECPSYNGFIYCIGGEMGSFSYSSNVYVSKIGANGNALAWVSNAPLPAASVLGVVSQSCPIYLGRIYCMGGVSVDSGGTSYNTGNVLVGVIGPNGNVLSWTTNTPLPFARIDQACLAASGFIYCIGGSSGSSNTYVAQIASNGNVMQWAVNSLYPTPITDPSCNMVSAFIYCVGGQAYPGTYESANVYVAKIQNQTMSITLNALSENQIVLTYNAAGQSQVLVTNSFSGSSFAHTNDIYGVFSVNANLFNGDSSYIVTNALPAIIINPALTIPTLSFSNTPTFTTNQWETLTATGAGGSTPYTINFLVYNSVTNVLIGNLLLIGSPTPTNTYTFQVPSYWPRSRIVFDGLSPGGIGTETVTTEVRTELTVTGVEALSVTNTLA